VWNFLTGGQFTIADIFDIDYNYKVLIESLREALRSEMDEATFQASFDLRFVVHNARGEETPLTQRGRLERVTLANCLEFIYLANEFRMSELRGNLNCMKVGLWENLDIPPPAFLTGDMLEFAACGMKEITARALLETIRFDRVSPEQQRIILAVLERMTPEQRSAFLRFSTGRVRMPAHDTGGMTIRIDYAAGMVNKLPTASTCFNQLHVPLYDDVETAFRLITVACEFTGTFELR
jgi:hypothetical protein